MVWKPRTRENITAELRRYLGEKMHENHPDRESKIGQAITNYWNVVDNLPARTVKSKSVTLAAKSLPVKKPSKPAAEQLALLPEGN